MKGELQNFQVLGGRDNYLKVCILIIHTHMLCLPPIPPFLSSVCVCGVWHQCRLPVVAIQKLYVR